MSDMAYGVGGAAFGSIAAGIAFLAACDVAFNAYSASCSSPQTTELFAEDRQDTLEHWTWIADGTAVGFGVLGSVIGGSWWPLIGAVIVVVMMHYYYRHAVKRGLNPPAESRPNPER